MGSKKVKGWSYVFAKRTRESPWGFYKTDIIKDSVRPSVKGQTVYRGYRLDVCIGRIYRPVANFFKPIFWSSKDEDKLRKNIETNPWNSGEHLFVISIPFVVTLYFAGIWRNDTA